MCWLDNIMMVVADVLVSNRHQTIIIITLHGIDTPQLYNTTPFRVGQQVTFISHRQGISISCFVTTTIVFAKTFSIIKAINYHKIMWKTLLEFKWDIPSFTSYIIVTADGSPKRVSQASVAKIYWTSFCQHSNKTVIMETRSRTQLLMMS